MRLAGSIFEAAFGAVVTKRSFENADNSRFFAGFRLVPKSLQSVFDFRENSIESSP